MKFIAGILVLVLLFNLPNTALAFDTSSARAARLKQQQTDLPAVPESWLESVCRQGSRESCLAAHGWHWLRKTNFVVDPAIKVIQYSGGTYVLGLVAQQIVGDTAEVQFVLTVSAAGMRAGFITLVGGVVIAIVGTLATAGTMLLGMTTSTASKEMDEIPGICRGSFDEYKTPEGIMKLRALSPEAMARILPCIPQDAELFNFLVKSAENGQAFETQIKQN